MGSLARRLLVSSDADRKRLERSLHDGAQQRIVAASTTLGLALRRVEAGEEGAAQLVEEALEELRRCGEDLRDLARDIYPTVLAERGLASALEDLAHRAPGIVEIAVGEDRYPEPIELAVYLVVLEVLRGDYGGSEVTIGVAAAGGELVLDVRGARLEPDAIAPLRDRIESLDGRIDSAADSVRAVLPVGI
jgi:signal transduction histidine kinase